MKLSELKSFFYEELSSSEFKKDIIIEVEKYKSALNTRGKSAVLNLIEDGSDLYLGKKEFKILCDAYLSHVFDKYDLNYIADIVLLSEKVSFGENSEDFFSSLGDVEIIDILNEHYINDLIKKISM